MSKTKTGNSNVPPEKSSFSTGTRGDAAVHRNQSGNHHGNRVKSPKNPGIKHR